LPIEALINQFKDPAITGNKYMMQTFDLMYIKKALKQDKVSINSLIERWNRFTIEIKPSQAMLNYPNFREAEPRGSGGVPPGKSRYWR
jgi:hypothetical protein